MPKPNKIPRSFRTYWGSYSRVKQGNPRDGNYPRGGYLGSYSRQVGPSRPYTPKAAKPKAYYDGIGTYLFNPR